MGGGHGRAGIGAAAQSFVAVVALEAAREDREEKDSRHTTGEVIRGVGGKIGIRARRQKVTSRPAVRDQATHLVVRHPSAPLRGSPNNDAVCSDAARRQLIASFPDGVSGLKKRGRRATRRRKDADGPMHFAASGAAACLAA